MRKKYEISDTIKVCTEFTAFSHEPNPPVDNKAEFARLFLRRAGKRHYVATGYVAQLQTFDASDWRTDSVEDLDRVGKEGEGEGIHGDKEKDALLMEMNLTFMHDPAV